MGYNEKELQAKLQEEKQQSIVLPTKKDTVGSLLREKREELHLSIESISADLRIKPQYLLALEEDRFNSLPGSAYVIGFIKSYASYLKLDTANIISLYKQESLASNRETLDLIEDENSLIHDPVINSNHIIVGSIVNDNISVGASDEQQSPDTAELTISDKPIADYFETKIDSIDMENNTVANSSPAESVENATTSSSPSQNSEGVSQTQEATPAPVNEENIANTPSVAGQSREYGVANKNSARIALRATKNVWIKLKKGGFYKYDKDSGDVGTGETVFETILEPGDVYYVANEPELYMTIGNAQGVDILVDGKVIEPLTTREISRHNVEMDVEKLLNKTAYVRNRKVD